MRDEVGRQAPGAIIADQAERAHPRRQAAARGHQTAHVADVLFQLDGFLLERGEGARQRFEFRPAAFHFAQEPLEFLDLVLGQSDRRQRQGEAGSHGAESEVPGVRCEERNRQRCQQRQPENTDNVFLQSVLCGVCVSVCESRPRTIRVRCVSGGP
jgi:hypothetical protein